MFRIAIVGLATIGLSWCGPAATGGEDRTTVDAGPDQPGTGTLTVLANQPRLGRIVSEPEGLDCPTKCTATFPIGTEVSLTIKPEFRKWIRGAFSGACSGAALEGAVTIDRVKVDCTVELVEQSHLTFGVVKDGRVFIEETGQSCTTDACEAQFDFGSRFTLVAEPPEGQRFAMWEKTVDPEFVVARAAVHVVANNYWALAVFGPPALRRLRVTGPGHVEIPLIGAHCRGACTYELPDANLWFNFWPDPGAQLVGYCAEFNGGRWTAPSGRTCPVAFQAKSAWNERWVNTSGVIALAPDGTQIASDDGKTIHVADVVSGRRSWSVQSSRATKLAFSPDGARLHVLGLGGLSTRSMADGTELLLPGQPDDTWGSFLSVAADGSVATQDFDGDTAILSPTGTGARFRVRGRRSFSLTPVTGVFAGDTGTVTEFYDTDDVVSRAIPFAGRPAWSADGTRLLLQGDDEARLLTGDGTGTLRTLPRRTAGAAGGRVDACFTAGNRVVARDSDALWTVDEAGTSTLLASGLSPVAEQGDRELACGASTSVVVAHERGLLTAFNTAGGERRPIPTTQADAVGWTLDGRVISVRGGLVRRWSIDPPELTETQEFAGFPPTGALSADGSRYAGRVARESPFVHVMDTRTGDRLAVLEQAHTGLPTWSPDGRLLAIGSHVFETTTWSERVRASQERNIPFANRGVMATTSHPEAEGTIVVTQEDTLTIRHRLPRATAAGWPVALTADATKVLVLNGVGEAGWWDVATDTAERGIHFFGSSLGRASSSDDGSRMLFAQTLSSEVRDFTTDEALLTLTPDAQEPRLSPDGRFVAARVLAGFAVFPVDPVEAN